MAAIQPRKTEYKGTVFRSRIEAQWAIFFDALGVQNLDRAFAAARQAHFSEQSAR